MEDPSPLARALQLVLGTEPKMQFRVRQSLFTVVIYAMNVALLAAAWRWGQVAAPSFAAWTALVVVAEAAFFGLIRSGVSERWADPALTVPQMVFAIVATSGAYALLGDLGTPAVFSLILTFAFGAFSTTGRKMLWFTTAAILGILGAAVSQRGVELSPLDVSCLLALSFVLPGMAVLASRFNAMRRKLVAQKASLETALQRIETLASTDALTGLYNRRYMTDAMGAELSRADRGGDAPCIVLIDVDHFKSVNDRYGHPAGDRVLQALGRLAASSFRGHDLVGRWGGEEFVVVIHDSDPASAASAVQRFAGAFRALEFTESARRFRVSFSAGLCRYRAGETLGGVFERVDAALYRAKDLGRDRVVAVRDDGGLLGMEVDAGAASRPGLDDPAVAGNAAVPAG